MFVNLLNSTVVYLKKIRSDCGRRIVAVIDESRMQFNFDLGMDGQTKSRLSHSRARRTTSSCGMPIDGSSSHSLLRLSSSTAQSCSSSSSLNRVSGSSSSRLCRRTDARWPRASLSRFKICVSIAATSTVLIILLYTKLCCRKRFESIVSPHETPDHRLVLLRRFA